MEIIEALWNWIHPEWRAWVVLGGGVLLGVEALATGFPAWLGTATRKRATAIVTGPLAGLVLYLAGQMDAPLHGEYAPGSCIGDEVRHVLGAALYGGLGTLAAILAHDYLGAGAALKALSERVLGRTSTPAAPAGGE